MILAGQLLIDDGAARCTISPGFVRLHEDTIAEVVVGEIPKNADFGGEATLISPGFIDAHLHLPQFDMIGAHGIPLLRWLGDITFPAEIKWEDADVAREMTGRVVKQLLSKGTTGICAYATVHHASAKAAIEIATAAGLRGVIGQVLMNRQAPKELCRGTDQLLDEVAELGTAFPPELRMAAAITPRFAISCSQDLLSGAGRLSQQQGSKIQSHLAETINECRLVDELFDGRSYVDVYLQAGLLNERAIHGHGIHLDGDDRATLQQSGAVVAHCPTANSFLRSGTMDRVALMSDSVKLAVGSDIGAGYERSMVRVARAMIEAAASIGGQYPDAGSAWFAITAGNADALSWPDAGRLKVGGVADLLVVEPEIPWLNSPVDPLSMLMFAWDDRWLKHTILRGKVVS